MDTKGQRESRRITGLDETETIQDLTQKKKARKKKNVPIEVSEDKSIRSEMSDLTKYSSNTKASQERKLLRHQVEDQQKELDDKDNKISQLKELVAKQTLGCPKEWIDSLSLSDHNSGENMSKSPPPYTGDGEWNFEAMELDSQETDKDEEVEVVKVKGPEPPSKRYPDGLEMAFRGPPKQVKAVAEHYAKKGVTTIQTLPYKDGTITKVDLYKVVDEQKFKTAQQGQSHSVKFAPAQTIQEYDTKTSKLQTGKKMTVDSYPPEDNDEDKQSVSSSDSNSSGSRSSDGSASQSNSEADLSSTPGSDTSESIDKESAIKRQESNSEADSLSTLGSDTSEFIEKGSAIKRQEGTHQKSHKRVSSITQDTLLQAREITNEANLKESDGNGPTPNV